MTSLQVESLSFDNPSVLIIRRHPFAPGVKVLELLRKLSKTQIPGVSKGTPVIVLYHTTALEGQNLPQLEAERSRLLKDLKAVNAAITHTKHTQAEEERENHD
jgi:hypothetical protein